MNISGAWRGEGAERVLSLTVSCQQMSRTWSRAQPSQHSRVAKSAGACIFARFAGPIANAHYVTAGQSARDAVTARAKYSRYISRPVATANYPQSRAGGRQRRISSGLRADGGDKCVRAVREVRTEHGETPLKVRDLQIFDTRFFSFAKNQTV